MQSVKSLTTHTALQYRLMDTLGRCIAILDKGESFCEFYCLYQGGSSVTVILCLCIGGFICCICFVILYSSKLFSFGALGVLCFVISCGISWLFIFTYSCLLS